MADYLREETQEGRLPRRGDGGGLTTKKRRSSEIVKPQEKWACKPRPWWEYCVKRGVRKGEEGKVEGKAVNTEQWKRTTTNTVKQSKN